MRETLGCLSIIFVLFVTFRVFWGKTKHDVSALVIPVKIWVHNSCFFWLICGIENLEYIFADEFVVSIEVDGYWVGGAIVVGGHVDIFKGSFSVFFFNIGVGGLVDVVEIEVFAIDLIGSVGWGVIDDDCKIVGVILSENWVEVVLYSELCVVVVARNDEAHG